MPSLSNKEKLEIREIPVNKIKEDPHQPRKSFNENKIKDMALSIQTVGIINPIEIDEDMVIVTGAMRFRAAKEAGLKTVPCKVIEISRDERFLRQVVENIHHNTMTAWDTSQCLRRLLDEVLAERGEKHSRDRGYTELGNKIGMAQNTVGEYIAVTEASENFQKAVKGGLNHTFIRAIKRVPEEFKQQMEDKILSGGFKSREGAVAVSQAISERPDLADRFLKQDYSACEKVDDVKDKIKKIDPDFTQTPVTDAFNAGLEFPDKLGKVTSDLIKLLGNNPMESVGKIHLMRVIENLTLAKRAIDAWTSGKELGRGKETKQLK